MGGSFNESADGFYAKKQIFCKDPLIAFSHRSRFELGLTLVAPLTSENTRLLDYGCGDGTFLRTLHSVLNGRMQAIGAEIDPSIVSDCTKRFHHIPELQFVHIDALNIHERDDLRFDTIVCMEVLEHVVKIPEVLDRMSRLLARSGKLVISVPVETGPVLAGKQIARRIAGWRGLGDYPGSASYTWPESLRSVFAGSKQHIPRPVHGIAEGKPHHCHKGFNWKVLRDQIRERFEIIRILSSPFPTLPPGLGSQVWFIAQHR